jgi:hypothetical protein
MQLLHFDAPTKKQPVYIMLWPRYANRYKNTTGQPPILRDDEQREEVDIIDIAVSLNHNKKTISQNHTNEYIELAEEFSNCEN